MSILTIRRGHTVTHVNDPGHAKYWLDILAETAVGPSSGSLQQSGAPEDAQVGLAMQTSMELRDLVAGFTSVECKDLRTVVYHLRRARHFGVPREVVSKVVRQVNQVSATADFHRHSGSFSKDALVSRVKNCLLPFLGPRESHQAAPPVFSESTSVLSEHGSTNSGDSSASLLSTQAKLDRFKELLAADTDGAGRAVVSQQSVCDNDVSCKGVLCSAAQDSTASNRSAHASIDTFSATISTAKTKSVRHHGVFSGSELSVLLGAAAQQLPDGELMKLRSMSGGGDCSTAPPRELDGAQHFDIFSECSSRQDADERQVRMRGAGSSPSTCAICVNGTSDFLFPIDDVDIRDQSGVQLSSSAAVPQDVFDVLRADVDVFHAAATSIQSVFRMCRARRLYVSFRSLMSGAEKCGEEEASMRDAAVAYLTTNFFKQVALRQL